MKVQLETDRGWTEAIIDDDCEYDKFYKVANLLQNEFYIKFTEKIDDFDSLYWTFDYKGSELVHFYNIYEGTSVFPRAFKDATETDNQRVKEFGELVFQKLIELDWLQFEKGKTVGKIVSGNGTIILDIENTNGARITLLENYNGISFAITLAIYGMMSHTHFENELEEANEYIQVSQHRINRIFEMYDVPVDRQNEYWQTKLDKMINQLIETNIEDNKN